MPRLAWWRTTCSGVPWWVYWDWAVLHQRFKLARGWRGLSLGAPRMWGHRRQRWRMCSGVQVGDVGGPVVLPHGELTLW
jgi:hypothetical protein